MAFRTPSQLIQGIAARARDERVRLGYTQKDMAERSGVSFGTYRRFEQTGQIALESLAKVAIALRMESKFDELFSKTVSEFGSLEDVERAKSKERKRPRRVRHQKP